jgi:hypothetical protein
MLYTHFAITIKIENDSNSTTGVRKIKNNFDFFSFFEILIKKGFNQTYIVLLTKC